MNKFLMAMPVALLLTTGVCHGQFGNLIKEAENTVNKDLGKNGGNSVNNLSKEDISNALHQALQVGAKNATSKLSAVDGYFGNSLIKIVMPPEAKKVETTLRDIGLGKQVDDAVLSMNRAAEDAATKALPIFVDAIKGMTIDDGLAILQGGNDAATQYLKNKTTASLTAAFKPVITNSLDKVNATKYWKDVFTAYNEIPFTERKVNPDLVAYVTDRALNGLFIVIAQEEAKIRLNPEARVTDLLQKVFGAH
jgi:Protein of unknown function (DUF4197)